MAMRKTTRGEGKLNVLVGREAQVLNDHFRKNAKYALSEFSDEEMEALQSDLSAAKAAEENPVEDRTGGDSE